MTYDPTIRGATPLRVAWRVFKWALQTPRDSPLTLTICKCSTPCEHQEA